MRALVRAGVVGAVALVGWVDNASLGSRVLRGPAATAAASLTLSSDVQR